MDGWINVDPACNLYYDPRGAKASVNGPNRRFRWPGVKLTSEQQATLAAAIKHIDGVANCKVYEDYAEITRERTWNRKLCQDIIDVIARKIRRLTGESLYKPPNPQPKH